MENKTDTPLRLIFRTIDLYMGKIHPSVFHNNNISFKFKHGYIYVFCNDVAIYYNPNFNLVKFIFSKIL